MNKQPSQCFNLAVRFHYCPRRQEFQQNNAFRFPKICHHYLFCDGATLNSFFFPPISLGAILLIAAGNRIQNGGSWFHLRLFATSCPHFVRGIAERGVCGFFLFFIFYERLSTFLISTGQETWNIEAHTWSIIHLHCGAVTEYQVWHLGGYCRTLLQCRCEHHAVCHEFMLPLLAVLTC